MYRLSLIHVTKNLGRKPLVGTLFFNADRALGPLGAFFSADPPVLWPGAHLSGLHGFWGEDTETRLENLVFRVKGSGCWDSGGDAGFQGLPALNPKPWMR